MNSIIGVFRKTGLNSLNLGDSLSCLIQSKKQSKNRTYNFGDLSLFIKTSDISDNPSLDTKSFFTAYSGVVFPNLPPLIRSEELETEKLKHIVEILDLDVSKIRTKLNGFYNIIWINKIEQQLSILNDAFGLYPLYYINDEHYFAFSTSYQSLVLLIKDKIEWDTQAITDYLIWGNTLNNRTMMQKIKMLPPASKVVVNLHNGDVRFYEKTTIIYPNKNSLDEWASQYITILKKKINLFLKWYPDVDITLTGGTDTRIILAMIDEFELQKRQFITFRNPFMPDCENEDIVISKKISQLFNLNHKVLSNSKYAIANADTSFFCEENYDILLSGYIGSEALRFSPSYSNNIPEYARFVLPANMEYDKVYDSFLNPKERQYKSLPERRIIRRLKPFLRHKSAIGEFSENELRETIRHISSPFSEVAYMNTVLSRSFFSRINGGMVSSQLMPVELMRHVFSPYALPDLMQLSLSLHPRFLNAYYYGATNHLLEHLPKCLLQIPSNSHLADNTNTLLKRQTGLKHVTVYRSVNYKFCLNPVFREFVLENTPFNYDNIFSVKHKNTESSTHVWADILLFMKYISDLVTT